MPTIENEPSLTDIMNELKSFKKKKKTIARLDSIENRFDEHDARFDSIEKEIKNDIKKIGTKLNNFIKLNNLKV